MKVDPLARGVRVTIHRAALEAIFTECDRYDHDETGGRLLGEYRRGRGGRLSITVSGIIEPGPNARRTATSFFQDGEYQEEVFRRLEVEHPRVEHLGNWHTHHVNGYPTLSGGDRETYHRIVNHPNHNTDFFYAILVTTRNERGEGLDRYAVKHFILYRGDAQEYEIPTSSVWLIDRPALWPLAPTDRDRVGRAVEDAYGASEQRAQDGRFFEELHPGLRPYLSKKTGRMYWRGRIPLVDGTNPEIVAAEVADGNSAGYVMHVAEEPAASTEAARAFAERRFRSAREAVVLFERELNREVFRIALGREAQTSSARKAGE
jgi:integrative and conjugative element protein (TIGR02256 family)